jgi:hypothetical protein
MLGGLELMLDWDPSPLEPFDPIDKNILSPSRRGNVNNP